MRQSLERVLRGEIPAATEVYPCPFDGRLHWYQAMIVAYHGAGCRGALVMHVDVTELQRDPLTCVPNRTLYKAENTGGNGFRSAA